MAARPLRTAAGRKVNGIEPEHESAVDISKHHPVVTQGGGSDFIALFYQLSFQLIIGHREL